MFTGIIQATGTLDAREPTPAGARLLLDPGPWAYRPAPGDSIALNGCCLTVAALEDRRIAFDAIHETLAKTTLGDLEPGHRVHLEHAATPETFLGGHVVQGHVDGVGEVLSVQGGDDYRVRLAPPPDLMRFVSPKGSIALDGVSLTVAALDPRADRPWLEVALIPTTLERTAMASWRPGTRTNVEMDAINKMVVHYLEHYAR